MARYRKVEVRMWGDTKFRLLNSEEKLLWCYLLTGPETSAIPGVITAGEGVLIESMGWTAKQFRNRFGTLSERMNIHSDLAAKLIFLPSAVRHNPPANPNVVRGWARSFIELPESPLITVIVEKISSTLKDLDESSESQTNHLDLFIGELPKRFRNGFETVPKQFRIQDQDQDQEQNKEKPLSSSLKLPAEKIEETSAKKSDIETVLARYQHHHPRSRPGDKEKALVRARLGEGYSPEDLVKAIDTIHANPFFCGQNDRHTTYHKLIHALRNSDTVTSHLEWSDKNNGRKTHHDSIWATLGASWGLRPHEADELALQLNYDEKKFNEAIRVYFG